MISRKWSPCSSDYQTCNHALTWGKSISRLANLVLRSPLKLSHKWTSSAGNCRFLRLQISLVVRPPAWTLMTGLHCCVWLFYSLSQNTTVLRLMQRFVEQRRGSLCPLVAGRDVDAFWRIGRGAAEVTFPDTRAGRQSSPIGSPLNNYEAVLIPDHNEATGVHHRSSPDVNGGDNRLICRKINKYGWKLRLPAYKEEGDTLPCKAFKWKIITILKESVCVVYLLFRQHFS